MQPRSCIPTASTARSSSKPPTSCSAIEIRAQAERLVPCKARRRSGWGRQQIPNELETSMASITPDLIRYMAKAATSPVPPPVGAKAKHHILDTLAAMVSGTTIKPGEFALRYIEQLGGKPEAQVAVSGHMTSAINAAWAN